MRGLLTIESLYHQIIKGNKTQTRRSGGLQAVNHKPDYWFLISKSEKKAVFIFNQDKQRNPDYIMVETCKPRYKVGEVLYLKEPYATVEPPEYIKYLFDLSPEHDYRQKEYFKWENKLFMPTDFARAFIKITGIKCERLLDISDEDCIAEGIFYHRTEGWENYDKRLNAHIHSYGHPRNSFLSLFRFANKISPKQETGNPWVFAYTFEYLPSYKL